MREVVGDASRDGEFALVQLRIVGDRIIEADAEGLSEPLAGLSLLEAAAVPGETLAADALANALGPIFRAAPSSSRVAVAMSGGVDSAVALLRARESGGETVGVTLRLWIDPAAPDAARACCSPEAVVTARETCHRLGVPHVTLDLREEFRRAVVAPFVAGYARGETPNPCSRCNGGFRFGQLLAFARRAGAGTVVTGHYARLVRHRGQLLLGRGTDAEKDQSYMLARVEPRLLERLAFPLGDSTKAEVRAEAERAGLAVARRPESQEACFLGGDDYRRFLERRGLSAEPGEILDERGDCVGHHTGHWRFTPGQRRGLGLSAPAPLYALRTDARANTVTVGPLESLARRRVSVRGRLHVPVAEAFVRLRHRGPCLATEVHPRTRGFSLRLSESAYGVAPGQTAAIYEGDAVVGSGVVVSASGT